MRYFLPIFILALLTACGGDEQPQRLETKPLHIVRQDGREIGLTVEIADEPEEQAKGLMYRKLMPEDRGMLFVFEGAKKRSFWMRNTSIPLDMIFIGKSGKIVFIYQYAKPFKESSISSRFPASMVLEVNAGASRRWGVSVGDRVFLKD